MKKTAVVMLIIAILSVSLAVTVFGDTATEAPVPTSTAVPQGIVLDSSIVFAILIFAAAIGVGAGYWFARRR
ncbi:MAG: hypothetical protein E7675_00985 [Ruminococcaceae bacterium]|nr:hypothetical protein [Oscillospiraceae bacterium]